MMSMPENKWQVNKLNDQYVLKNNHNKKSMEMGFIYEIINHYEK